MHARRSHTHAQFVHVMADSPCPQIFESGAILLYLADKYGGENTPEQRAAYTKWVRCVGVCVVVHRHSWTSTKFMLIYIHTYMQALTYTSTNTLDDARWCVQTAPLTRPSSHIYTYHTNPQSHMLASMHAHIHAYHDIHGD